jgi:hypothetical protein
MSLTGTAVPSVVTPGYVTSDMAIVAGVPTHVASTQVGAAGTYFVVAMVTVTGTTANVWLGSAAGANVGVYAMTSSSAAVGIAALVKLPANSLVHLNCQATGIGKVVARPDLVNRTASQTSISAVLVGP